MKNTTKYKGLCAQRSLTLFSSPGDSKCISSRGSMFPDVEAGLIVNVYPPSLLHFRSFFTGLTYHSFNVIFVRQTVSCYWEWEMDNMNTQLCLSGLRLIYALILTRGRQGSLLAPPSSAVVGLTCLTVSIPTINFCF